VRPLPSTVLGEIILRVAAKADLEFLFSLLRASLGPYVEQTYGPWRDDEQRARFFASTDPATHQMIELDGRPVGCLALRWLPVRLRVFRVNPARRFYERLGFVTTGETETHVLMEHPVSPSW